MDVVQINAPVRSESIIVTELDPLMSREAATMNAGISALQHAVLGQTTTTGLYSPISGSASDGTQNAGGVAIYPSDSDGNVTVLKRGPVVVRQDMLVWPDGFTNTQIAAGLAQLTAAGIVSRVTG